MVVILRLIWFSKNSEFNIMKITLQPQLPLSVLKSILRMRLYKKDGKFYLSLNQKIVKLWEESICLRTKWLYKVMKKGKLSILASKNLKYLLMRRKKMMQILILDLRLYGWIKGSQDHSNYHLTIDSIVKEKWYQYMLITKRIGRQVMQRAMESLGMLPQVDTILPLEQRYLENFRNTKEMKMVVSTWKLGNGIQWTQLLMEQNVVILLMESFTQKQLTWSTEMFQNQGSLEWFITQEISIEVLKIWNLQSFAQSITVNGQFAKASKTFKKMITKSELKLDQLVTKSITISGRFLWKKDRKEFY